MLSLRRRKSTRNCRKLHDKPPNFSKCRSYQETVDEAESNVIPEPRTIILSDEEYAK